MNGEIILRPQGEPLAAPVVDAGDYAARSYSFASLT
jgi:hypothetical protein